MKRTSLRSKWVQLKKKKKKKKKRTNRILVIDSTVAATTFGLPKPNGVIIAGSCKYHRRLAHFLVNFKNQINKNINHRILEWMKTNINIFTDCCNKICGIRIRVVRGFGELLLCLCSDLEKWPFLFLFLFLFIGLSASQSQESNRTQHSPLGFDIC